VLLVVSVSTLLPVAGLGLNAAVTPLGNPEAARVTLPANPPYGFTVMVVVLDKVCGTEIETGEAARVKPATPVPLNAMLCDVYPGAIEFRSLFVSTSEPFRVPNAVGAKLMGKIQDAPAASVPAVEEPEPTSGQSEEPPLGKVKFGVMLGLLPVDGIGKLNGMLPMFSTVTVCVGPVEPTATFGKLKLGGSTKSSWSILLFPKSATKRLPAPSTAMP
jgi:hypothetical protein